MALGRQEAVQEALLIGWHEVPVAPGHVFYDRLNGLLDEAGFDLEVEALCTAHYASGVGRPKGSAERGGGGSEVWLRFVVNRETTTTQTPALATRAPATNAQAQALLTVTDALTSSVRGQSGKLAAQHRLFLVFDELLDTLGDGGAKFR